MQLLQALCWGLPALTPSSLQLGTACPALTALVTEMNLSKLIRTMLKTEAVHTR